MSWQEELRNLDEELASGRLSADDYRLRRDQVLSSAVAYGDPAQQQQQGAPAQPPQSPQQYQQPYQPQQQPQYQQPQNQAPQQPQQQPGQQQPAADSTQIIAPVSPPSGIPAPNAEATQIVSAADTGAERTQVVPGWQSQQPLADQSRTQVVPGHNSPPSGFPQQQAPHQGWNTPDADLSPPWGGSDFPPISPVGSSEWVKQGPELFDDKPKGKGGKVAILVVVAVLVLGGLGVGGFFLFKGDGSPQANGPVNQTSTSQPAPPPKPRTPGEQLFDRIPKQTGDEDPQSGDVPVSQLVSAGYLDESEASKLTSAGVSKVAWRGSQKKPDETGPQTPKISITIIPMTSPGGATELLKGLRQYQTTHGFTVITDTLPNIPATVNFQKKVTAEAGTYRATWISGNNIVRVDIAQNPLGDPNGENALSGTYQRAVKKTLENFPVSE
ncbi:flagellar basal body-associated protein FliL [Amycolatopsis sp. H20-H5]|uniref:flagellar basal body-associated protein FliL n=1 Tax=Amycolatopsis sp. H20-H5 TaxID=3046309 RepID=UPI002DBEADFB|nr:flagellar basal body-associated protein FliL [Amycolatopsis sp. H20-H5]MEC3981432.1 flagellar basal body-associated protein FliL [Amycolatopsis sp. H20-H5]